MTETNNQNNHLHTKQPKVNKRQFITETKSKQNQYKKTISTTSPTTTKKSGYPNNHFDQSKHINTTIQYQYIYTITIYPP